MREAVIVSAARTPIGRAFRGAFNQTPGATMAGHAVKHAMERARIDPAEVDDVIMGCGLPEGATGNNIGRTAALRAGCPVSVPGQTVSRYCASGLDAIAAGAKRVIADGADVDRRRRRRVDQHGAERSEHAFLHRGVAAAPRARPLHADALHGRQRREEIRRLARAPRRIRAAEPAAHGRGAGRGPVRRRDRAAAVVEVRAGQRHRRGAPSERVDSRKTKAIAPTRRSRASRRCKGAVPGIADTTITAGNSLAAFRRRRRRRDHGCGARAASAT